VVTNVILMIKSWADFPRPSTWQPVSVAENWPIVWLTCKLDYSKKKIHRWYAYSIVKRSLKEKESRSVLLERMNHSINIQYVLKGKHFTLIIKQQRNIQGKWFTTCISTTSVTVHLILLLIPLLWYGRLGYGELTHPASMPVLVVLGCWSQPPLGPSPNQFPLMQDRASPAGRWPLPSASPSLMPMWAAVFSSVACAPLLPVNRCTPERRRYLGCGYVCSPAPAVRSPTTPPWSI